MIKHLINSRTIVVSCFLLVSLFGHSQSPRGLYIGYQAGFTPGGINNLRAFVGAQNLGYHSLSKEMDYQNFLHGVSVGYIIKKKPNILDETKFSKKPFFELNWNNLHNSFTSEGLYKQGDNENTVSKYKVRINSLAFIVGFQTGKKTTCKIGVQATNFNIYYKRDKSSAISNTKYVTQTKGSGLPYPNFHFSLDYAISKQIFIRPFINQPIDIQKEDGYYYNTTNIGAQLLLTFKK